MRKDFPLYLVITLACFYLGWSASRIRRLSKVPTEAQIRIHEGIMDSYAERNVNPFLDTWNSLADKQLIGRE